MSTFFFNIILLGLTLGYLPKVALKLYAHELPKNYIPEKFGFGLKEKIRKSKGAIWVHAVSLGETRAIAPLVAVLKKEFPSTPFVFTTATSTGYNQAQKLFPNDVHFFLPLDIGFIIKPIVRKIHPKMLVFSETDTWPHLLQAAKEVSAITVVVSGKISEKSKNRQKKSKFITNFLWGNIDKILVQNKDYYERFLDLNIPKEKLEITGNLKYDTVFPKSSEEEKQFFKEKLGIDQAICIGSTHEGEEIELIRQIPENLSIILVPRHPQRFDEVAKKLEQENIPYYRFSEIDKRDRKKPFKVILVDAMGQLLKFYEASTLAIVGGSFIDRIGGHNILEPLPYGVPVLFGPHMYTQFELVDLVLKSRSGIQTDFEHINGVLEKLLDCPKERQVMGEKGKQLIHNLKGVTKKTLEEITALTVSNQK